MVFTAFFVVYMGIRLYWGRKADKRPAQEKKSFFLDKLNAAIVAIFLTVFPLLAIFTHLLDRFNYPSHEVLQFLSIPVLTGAVVTIWLSHRDLGENWSAFLALKQGHSLITNGIFRHIRHPMYLSIWLYVIGQAFCIPNFIGGLGAVTAWAFLYFARIEKEEQMMLEKFGNEYRQYMGRTKRLIPFVI